MCFVFVIYEYNKRNTTTVCWFSAVSRLHVCVMPYHFPVSRNNALHTYLNPCGSTQNFLKGRTRFNKPSLNWTQFKVGSLLYP